MLARAEQASADIARLEDANLGYIDDVIEALEWTDYVDEFLEELEEEELSATLHEPVKNPWRHVGWNDPCPRGSGKKAKKCCLGT